MKVQFLIAVFFASIVSVYAGSKSKITDVIVYQQGAKITREALVNLVPGNNEVVLSNLTTGINSNSLQVKIAGNPILLSASAHNKTLHDGAIPKRTKSLEDSLNLISTRINWLSSEKSVYQGEEQLITNQKLGSEKENISVDELIKLSEFYRKRLLDIRKRIYNIDNDMVVLNRQKALINQKINQLRYKEKKIVGEVILNISSKVAQTRKVQITYLSRQAGWTPVYDVRAKGSDSPLSLVYKANVYQHTGYVWDNVNLTISTGNPTANNTRPIMYPWHIDFAQDWSNQEIPIMRKKSMAASNMYAKSMEMEMVEDAELDWAEEEEVAVPYQVQQTTNRMSAEYKIEIAQDIPSDGKKHIVAIQEYELNSTYTYHSIPKLDKGAYLIAKVADYGKFNLLPGPSNLFFEGMYIGESYLNPVATTDSMLLSLGQDDKITVKRTQQKDLTAKQIIGGNIKETRGFEITIRNNNDFSIDIEVMDQLPISNNKEIEVKAIELNSAKYNEDNGSLLWKISLKAGETKKLKFSYSVKYPKDMTVSNF